MILLRLCRPISRFYSPSRLDFLRTMATVNTSSLSHLERTADEPRENALHKVTISRIDSVNENIRLFQLKPIEGKAIKYLPGQWLDVYCPGVPKAGGFTITSSPPLLSRKPTQTTSFSSQYIELAIQKSAQNPPAAWLWQNEEVVLGKELDVRVGGSFIWPPELLRGGRLKNVVFVAGGVGINPLMSMLSSIAELKEMRGKLGLGFEVKLLYTTRMLQRAEEILFLPRLRRVFESLYLDGSLHLFLTGADDGESCVADDMSKLGLDSLNMRLQRRRIIDQDLEDALGPPKKRSGTVCYICGVPKMTDEFVERAKGAEGMQEENVLFEKWW